MVAPFVCAPGPCICMNPPNGRGGTPIERLSVIRSGCTALHGVFLPDQVWSEFEAWHRHPDTVGLHRSVLLLALQRGHLDRVTSAVHRYLIEADAIRPDVRQQYLKDLQERWMFCTDPLERHRKSRIFRGRLAELQCAEWLQSRTWVIDALEALREGSDIEATAPDGVVSAFEVKFIGTQDEDFEMILRSVGHPAATSVSPYAAINYLLFRVYEAAKQLALVNRYRIAVVIVEDLTWWRFDVQLEEAWIDWSAPRFIGQDPDWEVFLTEQLHQYPELMSEMPSVLAQIGKIWIIRQSHGFQYHLEHELSVGKK